MQDDQFYYNKFQNFQNSNSEQPVYPDMTFMQQPGEDGRPPRRDDRQRDDRQRDNRPRDERGPGRDNQPPFIPPPPPPPFTPPPGEGGPTQAPRSAPPAFSPRIPSRQDGPRGIRNCLYRNTFIWLNNGNSFWFYPTFVGRQAVSGFRWRGFAWTFERINLNRIWSFQCF
ncbi:hypothetical protein [Anaerocolumna sp. MB42-C2]|uniref:hypothetical protein n=1 Tax=Anaerocolumna sp. MB42-C2 TaxID=3070997 RepID=UPI0027E18CCA|nr:hypothetical protein [Anaerocolumna sp. MB42-C2]WMJ89888.1 hypothetical protein RBU59_10285 [Anaerocolumna sp. MB42-C2]